MAEEAKKEESTEEGAPEGAAEGDQAVAEPAKKKSKLPIILAATVPLLVLILVQVGLFYAGVFDKFFKPDVVLDKDGKPVVQEEAKAGEKTEAKSDKPAKPENTIFYNLPDMLVNMMQEQDRISYLKLKVVLEVANKETTDKLQKDLPRVLDTIQVYVRELRVDDLKNSAGVEKFRQEVLKRLNLILDSKDVIDVYFPTMVTQ